MSYHEFPMNLTNTPENFQGGKIQHSLHEWRKLSSDIEVTNIVLGKCLKFDSLPNQVEVPKPYVLTKAERKMLDEALDNFLQKEVIELADNSHPSFYSNIFPVTKNDGTARVILNLKNLNEHVDQKHFKMDSIKNALQLMYPNCVFAKVDLKDAYFSCPIRKKDRKWFRFTWNGRSYQYKCLPQGLSSAPRLFTKLMKPVVSHLRKLGIFVVIYIDDLLFIASSKEELKKQIAYSLYLLDKLGLTINIPKSILEPTKIIEFVGFILNSNNMTIKLTDKKKRKISELGIELLAQESTSIRELARFIGNLVATEPCVYLAPLKFKYLEIIRNNALSKHNGNFDGFIKLDAKAREVINWWINNIHSQVKNILIPRPDCSIFTDASLIGWGAKMGNVTTGGHWALSEKNHINELELKAIHLGLRSLCSHLSNMHVRIYTDNTTAKACIEKMGSTHEHLLDLTTDIFEWASHRNIHLSAAYVKGSENVDADRESRVKNIDTEWMIKSHIFDRICNVLDAPNIDLFATRLNAQCKKYVSWKPDPYAFEVDAFSLPWINDAYYAFPPFSLIGPVLKKVREERATILLVAPLWPTASWFPGLLRQICEPPYLLPQGSLVLPQDPHQTHPLHNKLVLGVMKLSGDRSKIDHFRKTLPPLCWAHGDPVQENNIGHVSNDGCLFAYNEKLIHFLPL